MGACSGPGGWVETRFVYKISRCYGLVSSEDPPVMSERTIAPLRAAAQVRDGSSQIPQLDPLCAAHAGRHGPLRHPRPTRRP